MHRDQDGYMMERYRLKWAAKLTDIELKESMAMPDMTNIVKMDPARLRFLSSQFGKQQCTSSTLFTSSINLCYHVYLLGHQFIGLFFPYESRVLIYSIKYFF